MSTTTAIPTDPFAGAAAAAASEISAISGLAAERRRLECLARFVPRCGDVLADLLESLVGRLTDEDPQTALRLGALLLDVILAEEGFSRRFWRSLHRQLRLLHLAGRDAESERCLRESLELAAALG